ncbi:MAG: type I-C CRISPR-associated protein Cas5c [Mucinivorans sp.]
MVDNEIVKIKVTGDYACFTRPDLKVERMTYPCMTPSAARGILESILWKPEFQWFIRRVIVLNPIKFASVKRNEIRTKQGRNPIIIEDARVQRNSIILKNVAYIIEASICLPQYDPHNNVKKYTEIFRRRVEKGQCWHRPYLGTREFAAEFSTPSSDDRPFQMTYPIGNMLFDVFYEATGKVIPLFFYDAAIVDGVLTYPEELNIKMSKSSHLRPKSTNELNRVLYEFNQSEERL